MSCLNVESKIHCILHKSVNMLKYSILVYIDICEPNIFSNYLVYIFNHCYLEFYNYLLFT